MTKNTITSGRNVRANIKAGGMSPQHNRPGLRVRAAVKAGGMNTQHSRRAFHAYRAL